jgi:hypothetical protein
MTTPNERWRKVDIAQPRVKWSLGAFLSRSSNTHEAYAVSRRGDLFRARFLTFVDSDLSVPTRSATASFNFGDQRLPRSSCYLTTHVPWHLRCPTL